MLLGDEPHAPYERPPLSKAVLSGEPWRKRARAVRRAQALESMGIEFEPASRRAAAARRGQAGGHVRRPALAYDKLILCTGGRPAVPALPGVTMTVHVLRTRADAERLRARRLGPDRHVLIVGGGWIGLEVAATARSPAARSRCWSARRGCARSRAPNVGASGGAANGVALRLNAGLRAVGGSADGRPVAELADGSSIAADAIVLGVGLAPNDALARDAGIACDRGVLVDERCRTSAPDVRGRRCAVSRGPAAAACGWSPGRTRRIRAAALSALGLGASVSADRRVWSEQYDAMVQIVGFPALAASEVLRPQADARALLSVALDAEAAPWRA